MHEILVKLNTNQRSTQLERTLVSSSIQIIVNENQSTPARTSHHNNRQMSHNHQQ